MSAADLFSIAGKTALVTGGSRGIGKMIAEGFVEAGATVYISSRKADVCAEVAAELARKGTCIAIPADLSARGRVPAPGRRDGATRGLARHPGQQRGRDLGHAAGRLRRGGLRARSRAERQGCLPPHEVPRAAPGEGGDPGGTRPRHQHRVHRRDRRSCARDVLVLGVQGGRAPADPTPRQAPRPHHHGQRHRARPVRVQDDGRHAGRVPGPDRGGRTLEADRAPRRHGGRRHLPGVAGRRLPDRRRHPRRRGHRHHPL